MQVIEFVDGNAHSAVEQVNTFLKSKTANLHPNERIEFHYQPVFNGEGIATCILVVLR